MAQHQSKLYTVKTKSQEFAINSAEEMKVRLNGPKSTFDDMGNVKKYTAKELKELRGKDGYFDGEFADLTTGQQVAVTVLLPKVAPKPKNKDDILIEENKLEATKVIVVHSPPSSRDGRSHNQRMNKGRRDPPLVSLMPLCFAFRAVVTPRRRPARCGAGRP